MLQRRFYVCVRALPELSLFIWLRLWSINKTNHHSKCLIEPLVIFSGALLFCVKWHKQKNHLQSNNILKTTDSTPYASASFMRSTCVHSPADRLLLILHFHIYDIVKTKNCLKEQKNGSIFFSFSLHGVWLIFLVYGTNN